VGGTEVRLGRDVVVEPMTFLLGRTRCMTDVSSAPTPGSSTRRSRRVAVVDSSIVLSSSLGPETNIGPRAYLRPGTVIRARGKVGASVEIKNSVIGEGSKVPHLSYIGDAEVGKDVNIGAGTITCNYDGQRKNRTVIGDGAFIGSDTMLVAPVSIGAYAVTGAGSAIAEDVPDEALAIERTQQLNVTGWTHRRPSMSRKTSRQKAGELMSGSKRLMVFAGTHNRELSEGIAKHMGIELGNIRSPASPTARSTSATLRVSVEPMSSSCSRCAHLSMPRSWSCLS